MEYVYELWHFKIGAEDEPDTEDPAQAGKDIGIYTTEEKAKAAITRLKDKVGFRDWPGGFRIFRAPLDRDGWVDGFISWDDA
jgi:homoserine kinase type II